MGSNGKNCTKAMTEIRVNIILNLLIQGSTRRAIVAFCERWFNIGHDMTDRLIGQANKLICEAARFDRAQQVGLALERLEYLYNASIKRNDLRMALLVVAQKNDLLDLRTSIGNDPKNFGQQKVYKIYHTTDQYDKDGNALPVSDNTVYEDKDGNKYKRDSNGNAIPLTPTLSLLASEDSVIDAEFKPVSSSPLANKEGVKFREVKL